MTEDTADATGDGFRLKSVEIRFTRRRPKQKLSVTVKIGDTVFDGEFNNGETKTFELDIPCGLPMNVEVHIHKKLGFVKKHLKKKDTFAQITSNITCIDNNVHVTEDTTQAIRVTLTFSGVSAATQPELPVVPDVQPVVLRTRLDETREILAKKEVAIDKLGKSRRIVEILLAAGGAAAELNPIAKACVSALEKLYESCERQEEQRDAAIKLVERLDIFLRISEEHAGLQGSPSFKHAVSTMLILIGDVSEFITSREGQKNIDWSGEYQKKLSEFNGQFDLTKEEYDTCIATETHQSVTSLSAKIDQLQISTLRDLKPVFKAYHDPGEGCLKETRVEVRAKLLQWIQGIELSNVQDKDIYTGMYSKEIVWLCGLAGSGKSTIANTVAAIVEKQGFRLAQFFFKRDDPSRSSADRVFPTLSYQLTFLFPEYRDAILELLGGGDGGKVFGEAIGPQVEVLFTKVLPNLTVPDGSAPTVIVIDALDECSGSQAKIVEVLLAIANAAPWIKIFITRRDEGSIRDGFGASSLCQRIDINDIGDVDSDIRLFTEQKLDELKLDRAYADALTRKAGGLFIWSSTIFKFLKDYHNPKTELVNLLQDNTESPARPLERLHKLYDKVLEVIPYESSAPRVVHRVLAIVHVSSTTTPLFAAAIAAFLQTDPDFRDEDAESVERIINALRAVLYEDKNGQLVRAHHPSFLDYLEKKAAQDGWDSLSHVHTLMFEGSLAIMLQELKFNICGLTDASLLNKDVKDLEQLILKHIRQELQYGCEHWFTHLCNSNKKSSDAGARKNVSRLVCDVRIVFWLEVLSLTGAVERSVPILLQCSQFFHGFADITEACNDACRFVSSFSQSMTSTPHLYISAMPWLPTQSRLRQLLGSKVQSLILVSAGLPQEWDATVWTKHFSSTVGSVAYSPDGRRIAVGAGSDVYFLDSIAGHTVGEPLRGHTEAVRSVVFSSDGSCVASGSSDKAIRIWDAAAGKEICGPLEGHVEGVTSVAFSPDGTRLASGSYDWTVRIWNAKTGEAIGDPLKGHTFPVASVVFSSDGLRIASGEYRGTIRIWNSMTSESLGTFRGHSSLVLSLCFSPDGSQVVSGSSDNTLRMCDSQTGETTGELVQGHSGDVNCVAYSPNGAYIVSGSSDSTVRVWNSQTKQSVGESLQGHSASVTSAVFSPSGAYVVSGSEDKTVRLWQPREDKDASLPFQGHTEAITSVAFTPDGTRVVSGSADETISVWCSETGKAIGEPLRGHNSAVSSVIISPDGTRLASGSYDNDVRIWSLQAGETIGVPLRGHTGGVTSVAFAPDGVLVVSGSNDETLRIWNSITGKSVCEPLRGHDDRVRTVAVSPDGTWIVSGSWDGTIRRWDLRIGKAVGDPMRGHTSLVTSLAVSSDSTRLASGSWDKNVRIWNLATGDAMYELSGHSDRIMSVAFISDSSSVVSGSYSGTIQTWDSITGEAAGNSLRGHSAAIESVAVSPDGTRIASGSYDQNIFITTIKDAQHDSWKENCRDMNVADGWIKDGKKLLFWVPAGHRHWFRGNVGVWIRDGLREWERVPPKVDVELLRALLGERWTDVYVGCE